MIGKLPRWMPCPGRPFLFPSEIKDVSIETKETKCPSRDFMVAKMKGSKDLLVLLSPEQHTHWHKIFLYKVLV